MSATRIIEYRIEHLRERLAGDELAELGVRVELHGGRAVVRGCVGDEERKAAVLRIAGEELSGLDWYDDITLSRARPPDHAEELS
ncbi:hypothetical protein ACFY7H_01550 [Streptomyces sp. NPDC012794]|uniref:hypothetical protein n=1 Tax=Streptomyces sp. NPDC012794 TaxID=3364850 RepID=UPI00369D9C6A